MTAPAAPTIAERLAASHPSTSFARAALWQEFVDVALSVLRRAERDLRSPTTWSRFAQREGWWLGAQRKSANGAKVAVPSEDAITDALMELAEAIRKETLDDDPLKRQQITFDPQVRRPPHPRIGRKALTTDIRIRSLAIPDLEVRIEAKLLFRPKDLTDAYCGDKGLLRFADPRHPYTDRPIGFMLGYALQDHGADWDARIRTALPGIGQVKSTGEVGAGGETRPVSDMEWGTEERQKVSVIHLFMEFDTDPSCRQSASQPATPVKPRTIPVNERLGGNVGKDSPT